MTMFTQAMLTIRDTPPFATQLSLRRHKTLPMYVCKNPETSHCMELWLRNLHLYGAVIDVFFSWSFWPLRKKKLPTYGDYMGYHLTPVSETKVPMYGE